MAFSIASFFTDPDLDTLTYSSSGHPPGLTLNTATGDYTGTPTTTGTFATTVTATDPGTLSVSDTFDWVIAPAAFELIQFNFVNPVPNATIAAQLEEARTRWNSILTGPLTATPFGGDPAYTSIQVDISFGTIDGVGGTGAAGGVNTRRPGELTTLQGFILFDDEDIITASATSNFLRELTIHELGHVLGLGTTTQDVASGPLDAGAGTYTGTLGVAEYSVLTGNAETSFPTTVNGHWSEATFNEEIMTPDINNVILNPISKMTLAVLADLGYSPNYAQADPYTL